MKGSLPQSTASGSGASLGSWERSSWQANGPTQHRIADLDLIQQVLGRHGRGRARLDQDFAGDSGEFEQVPRQSNSNHGIA